MLRLLNERGIQLVFESLGILLLHVMPGLEGIF